MKTVKEYKLNACIRIISFGILTGFSIVELIEFFSKEEDDQSFFGFMLITVVFLLIVKQLFKGIINYNSAEDRHLEDLKKEEEKRVAELKVQEYFQSQQDEVGKLERTYGALTKMVRYHTLEDIKSTLNVSEVTDEHKQRFVRIDKSFLVFESSSAILIGSVLYQFTDLLSIEVSDNSQLIYSGCVATTEMSTRNMVKRALIGDVLAGPEGANLGALTAKTETKISGQTAVTEHDYTVIITVNSLSTPTIRLCFGNKEEDMQELTSVVSIILERNK